MSDLVLDANALSDLANGHRDTGALVEVVQRAGNVVLVPTICLVEALTGTARDAVTNQTLKGFVAVDLDVDLARVAARLRAAVDGDDPGDPVVVATAARYDATIVSTDPDIARLASHVQPAARVVSQRDL